MAFNMNSGYSGWSMSNNAVYAYENGEMPKSKWTKTAMLSAINDYLDEEDRCLLPDVDLNKMTKDEIFKKYFCYSSSHHTSKFANLTEFYSVDEDELASISKPVDVTKAEMEELITKIEEQRKEATECANALDEKFCTIDSENIKKYISLWEKEHNVPYCSYAGHNIRNSRPFRWKFNLYPDGNFVVENEFSGKGHECIEIGTYDFKNNILIDRNYSFYKEKTCELFIKDLIDDGVILNPILKYSKLYCSNFRHFYFNDYFYKNEKYLKQEVDEALNNLIKSKSPNQDSKECNTNNEPNMGI